MRIVIALALTLVLPCSLPWGQASGLPAKAGLAAQYPGEVGLERDPAVIFAEGFEGGKIPIVGYGQVGGFYDLKGYPKEMHITDKESAVGQRSLELLHPKGVISPMWFHRKFPGQDTIFVRFYRKHDQAWAWSPMGDHDTYLFAGRYDNPVYTDLTLYLDYWSSYRSDKELGGRPGLVLRSAFQGAGLDFGQKKEIKEFYYNLPYNRKVAGIIEGGRWYCFECMARMNSTPDKKDGEVRLWVNGELVTEMTGLILRNAKHRGIQWDHWTLGPRYGGQDFKVGPAREQKSWIDGIVVSRRYVGPVAPPKGTNKGNH